mgnify:CR=1 FL=1
MERYEAVKFFRKEIKRLVEEEHVVDLFQKNCAEELAAVECRITKAVMEYMDNDDIMLTDEEIPEGGCAALALWMTSSCWSNERLIEDENSFAHRLAKEDAGRYVKNIAYQMLDGEDLCCISEGKFFSDMYAKNYDEKYGNDAEK